MAARISGRVARALVMLAVVLGLGAGIAACDTASPSDAPVPGQQAPEPGDDGDDGDGGGGDDGGDDDGGDDQDGADG